MVDWPVTLPDTVLQQNYKESFVDGSIRTSMDQGPAKVRVRTLSNTKPYTMAIFLTNSQVDLLETFYTDTTSYGTVPFNMLDPRTRTTAEFRFKGPPTISPDGINFIALCEVEKMP